LIGQLKSGDYRANVEYGSLSDPSGHLDFRFTDVLQRIVSGQTKNHQLHTLLPWNWGQPSTIAAT